MILGRDGALYVTEAAGKLTRITLDASAPLRPVAEGLAMPEGVAQTPWGSFIVAETAAAAPGRDRSGERHAPHGGRQPADRPAAGPGMPPPYVPTGVAVGSDGTIYMTADRNNALYRIRPQR